MRPAGSVRSAFMGCSDDKIIETLYERSARKSRYINDLKRPPANRFKRWVWEWAKPLDKYPTN